MIERALESQVLKGLSESYLTVNIAGVLKVALGVLHATETIACSLLNYRNLTHLRTSFLALAEGVIQIFVGQLFLWIIAQKPQPEEPPSPVTEPPVVQPRSVRLTACDQPPIDIPSVARSDATTQTEQPIDESRRRLEAKFTAKCLQYRESQETVACLRDLNKRLQSENNQLAASESKLRERVEQLRAELGALSGDRLLQKDAEEQHAAAAAKEKAIRCRLREKLDKARKLLEAHEFLKRQRVIWGQAIKKGLRDGTITGGQGVLNAEERFYTGLYTQLYGEEKNKILFSVLGVEMRSKGFLKGGI